MKRLLSGVVVLCLLIAPVLMLMPGALAQTYEGELTIEDVDGGERSLFSIGEGVVFHVEAFEIVGGDSYELQHEILDFIVMRGGNVVWTLSAPTGANGVAEVTYYPMETGSHTVRVNYTDTILDTGTFMVYEPYLDSVNVKTSGFDWDSWEWFSTTVFRADDDMRIEVEALDQHGKIYTPGFGQYQVYYNITKDSTDVRDGSIWVSRNNGEGSTDFYLTNYDEGSYLIEIFEDWSREDLLGSAVFYVLDLEISISPDRDTYAQGQEITIDVSTSLDGSYQVRIVNETEVVMTGADWSASGSLWSRDYTIPGTVKDGVYSVQVLQDDNVLESVNFVVVRFWLTVDTNKQNYLPGEKGTMYFAVTSNLDGSPVSATVITELDFIDTDWEDRTRAFETVTDSSGSVEITMPSTARMQWHTLNVKATDGQGNVAEESIGIRCTGLSITGNANRGVFAPGQPMWLNVNARAGGDPVEGADINVKGEMDEVAVGWLTRTESFKTTRDGTYSYMVLIPEDAKEGDYVVNFTGTFEDQEDTGFVYFTVDATVQAYVRISFDKSSYIAGSEVVVSYILVEESQKTDGNVYYQAALNGGTIDTGHSNDGTINILLPAGSQGTLSVSIGGYTESGLEFGGSSSVSVRNAYLNVYSAKDFFSPGEVISFRYDLVGDTKVDVVCEIFDAWGDLVVVEEPSGSVVSYTVPSDGVSSRYTAVFYVTGENGVYTESARVDERVGYILSFSFDKRSYKPGDTIEVSYKLTPVGDVPEVVGGFMMNGQIMSFETENTLWTDEVSGTFEYTVPSDISDGNYIFSLSCSPVAGSVDVFPDGGGMKTVVVDSSAGALMYGTVAGMSVGNFLGLMVAIAALVVGLFLMFRKPGSGETASSSSEQGQNTPEYPVEEESFAEEPVPEPLKQTEPEPFGSESSPPEQMPPPEGDIGTPGDSPPPQ